jgi:hypothetical protein
MTVLSGLLAAVDVVDLTTPLQSSTPILELPPPFANTHRFELSELSRYDEKGPAWYWNDIHTGEHTGTHLDAPVHWVTGRDGLDVSQAPLSTLVAPAVVIDMTAEVAQDADFLLDSCWSTTTSGPGRSGTAPCPTGAGCSTAPVGRHAATTRPPSPTPTRTARTRPASPRNARGGWPRSRRSPGSAWRPWAPTRAPRTRSSPRSRATPR